jgi:hypothetical protein
VGTKSAQVQSAKGVWVLRDWLRRKDIEKFAVALAEDLGHRFPPKSEERTDKGAGNQLKAISERIYAQARHYRTELHLGVYGKAKLANVFRWRLKELGYSQGFVQQVTHGLVVSIAKPR